MVLGPMINLRFSQSLNASLLPIDSRPIDSRNNALGPIYSRVGDHIIWVRAVQPSNAPLPMFFRPFGSVILVRAVQL